LNLFIHKGDNIMLFKSVTAATYCYYDLLTLEELVVEALNTGVSTDGVAELYDETLDRYIQCRGRDCGTCNGVACEESVDVDMPDTPKAKALWQAADLPDTDRMIQAYGYDDIGGCHL
jgi:ferredoxin